MLGKMKVEKIGKNLLKDSFCEFGFQGQSTKEWKEKQSVSLVFVASNGRKVLFT